MDWDPTTCYHQVCVSNPPFRTMRADTLKQLRNHIEQLHGKTLSELHLHLLDGISDIPSIRSDLNNIDYLVSEWELLASYQINVLKENIKLVYYPTVPLDKQHKPKPNQPNFCGTCYNSDSTYSREWWRSKGILVSDRIWQEIVNISK